VPEGIAAELASLQAQIDELRAAAAKPKPEKNGDAAKPTKLSPHGKPTLEFGGQMQADTVYFSQDPESIAAVGDLQDGSQFRRLRLVARGKTWKQLQYALGVDFALANQPAFIDNYLEANDLPWIQNLRVGHYFEPCSLERVTQNRNNTFMERSLVDTFAPARNMGVMAFGWADSELATWQIGTFRTNSDNISNDTFDSGQALTMRGTWLPFCDEESEGRSYPPPGRGLQLPGHPEQQGAVPQHA
jgi:phosphate-selective porin OprO/OprP